MSERELDGLPVHGDIHGKYIAVQLSPSGRAWDVKIQRMFLEHVYGASVALDLSRPVRICRTKDGKIVSIIRSWN